MVARRDDITEETREHDFISDTLLSPDQHPAWRGTLAFPSWLREASRPCVVIFCTPARFKTLPARAQLALEKKSRRFRDLCLGQRWIEQPGAAIGIQRSVHSALRLQDVPKIQVDLCLIWTKSQRPPIACLGLSHLLPALKHIPKIGVIRCGGAVDRNRPSDQHNGLLGIPLLKRDHPKQVQAVRVARL